MLKVLKSIIYFIFCKLLYHVHYENIENEKSLDKCVICANHSVWMDPLYIFAVTKNMSIMAKAELFKNKLIGKIFLWAGIFPIHRGSKDSKSILHAVNILDESTNMKMLIFPEGTRYHDNLHKQAKVGATYIAIKANVQIIPVYISEKPKLFSRIDIKYGKPIYLDSAKHNDKEYIKEKSNEILKIIYNMK